MTWDVIMLGGRGDQYAPEALTPERTLYVPFGIAHHRDAASSSIADEFARFGLAPTELAWDVLNVCIAAYTADMRISRRDGYDGWTRDIRLHLAVRDPDRWHKATPIFQGLLSFLTGDHWEILIHEAQWAFAPSLVSAANERDVSASTVSLFSGGLDSYVGAIDELEQSGGQVLFVGHHGAGGGPTSTSQKKASAALHRTYSEDKAPFMQVWVSPPKGQHRASEITTRGRSIMFLGLGIAAASCLKRGRLVVPENGVISLNVPLTPARTGSFSTRTTHPYLISQMREMLTALGLSVTIHLPYRFCTKGEMVKQVQNPKALQEGLVSTMSCARPGVARFSTAKNPNMHCGYCLPCLIRRASLFKGGVDPTPYLVSDLRGALSATRNADLRALKMALATYEAHQPTVADVLKSGPLPATEGGLTDYLAMFRRGLAELQEFLRANS